MEKKNDAVWTTEPYRIFRHRIKGFPKPEPLHRAAQIRYTPESLEDCQNIDVSWPLYAIRGKPVTRELAMEIIRKTDDYLYSVSYVPEHPRNAAQNIFLRHGLCIKNSGRSESYDMSWFPELNWVCCGWCHPDGYIGINGFSCKWPTLSNLLDLWVYLIQNITLELDLVVAMTECEDRADPGLPFDQQVVCGLRVRGDTVTLLNRGMAQLLFRRYDKLYGDHRPLGPLADPRVMPEAKENLHVYFRRDNPTPRIEWSRVSSGCNYFLMWDDIRDGRRSRDDGRPDYLPPLPGKVDRNSPIFYGVPDDAWIANPVTLTDLEEFARLWQEELTGMRAEGPAIAALGANGPEQVTNLSATDHELLFVLADYLDEGWETALADCKVRLRAEGKEPFFVRAGKRFRVSPSMEEELFDLTLVCNEWDGPPPKLPVEVIAALTRQDGLLELDSEEVLRVLRRPGIMFCFEKSAAWKKRSKEVFDRLCGELEQEIAEGHAKFGNDLRCFVQLLCSPNLGFEEWERCVRILAYGGEEENLFRLQFEFRDDLPDDTLIVRGMIGARDGGDEAEKSWLCDANQFAM